MVDDVITLPEQKNWFPVYRREAFPIYRKLVGIWDYCRVWNSVPSTVVDDVIAFRQRKCLFIDCFQKFRHIEFHREKDYEVFSELISKFGWLVNVPLSFSLIMRAFPLAQVVHTWVIAPIFAITVSMSVLSMPHVCTPSFNSSLTRVRNVFWWNDESKQIKWGIPPLVPFTE